MIINFLILLAGLTLLLYSADRMINNADLIAKKFSVSPFVIGLTIVAFGTSIPELVITIFAAIKEIPATEAIIGNVIGSNIANIFLILGVSGIFFKINLDLIKKNDSLYLGLVTVYFSLIFFVSEKINIYISIGFLILILLFINYLKNSKREEKEEIDNQFSNLIYLNLLLSFIGMFIGGKLFLDKSLDIFTKLGLQESVIGLTVLAIGTSLPELTTVILSYIKKKGAIGVGNIVGSNMMNILIVFFSGVLIVQFRGMEFLATKTTLPHIYTLIAATIIFIIISRFGIIMNKVLSYIFILIYLLYICWVLV